MLRKWHGNPWATLAILCLGYFMTLVDMTIVNVAIPEMTDDLGASLDEILWVINAYTLAMATLIITTGRLGDLWGKRNLFISGVALFTLASLGCGLAQDAMQLIAFRTLQGLGAAMLIPQTLSIIADIFPKEKRGTALGIWGVVAGVSGIVGPPLGGLLITHFDWRWIFFINVPIGALVLLAAPVMARTDRPVKHRLDAMGVLLASVALFCLAFGLTEGERYDWNGWIMATLAGSALFAALFLLYERGQQDKEPLLPFSLFKDRNFSIVNFVGVGVSFGIIGLFLLITVYVQSVLGFSAMKTGLVLLPLAIGTMITAGPAGVLSERYGGKYILGGGLAGFVGGMVWLVEIAEPTSSWTTFVAPLALIGLSAGCTFIPMASEVMRNVPARLHGAASGVNNALREVGAVLAGAIIGAVLQAQLASALRDEAVQSAQALPEEYREGFVGGFSDAGSQGLEVGASAGNSVQVPEGVPQDVAGTMQNLAGQVFGNGFIDAMTTTMYVAAGVLLSGALACLLLKGGTGLAGDAHGLPESTPELSDEPKEQEDVAVRG
ncbi:MFS transporter [Streptomyces sp. T-3]|nr:MFS transporter [Streptomyces sp. T-3]